MRDPNIPAVAEQGTLARKKGAKNALELVMNGLFFFCGLVAVAFVLFITVYLVVSGLPAIREIGLVDFLFGTRWASTASDPSFGIWSWL